MGFGEYVEHENGRLVVKWQGLDRISDGNKRAGLRNYLISEEVLSFKRNGNFSLSRLGMPLNPCVGFDTPFFTREEYALECKRALYGDSEYPVTIISHE
jgi:hypothetical protein